MTVLIDEAKATIANAYTAAAGMYRNSAGREDALCAIHSANHEYILKETDVTIHNQLIDFNDSEYRDK